MQIDYRIFKDILSLRYRGIGAVVPILHGTEEVGDEYLFFFQPLDFGADADPGIF